MRFTPARLYLSLTMKIRGERVWRVGLGKANKAETTVPGVSWKTAEETLRNKNTSFLGREG